MLYIDAFPTRNFDEWGHDMDAIPGSTFSASYVNDDEDEYDLIEAMSLARIALESRGW